MILTIIAFILMLAVLVIVHEAGHFIAAKKSGVKVEEFAFGFPPRLWSTKRGETRYSINAIPLGGYVKMLGELEESKHPRAFENQPAWKRLIISFSGILMNVVLAWVILSIGFAIGMSPVVSNPDSIPGKKLSSEIIIADVIKDSPAQQAGLEQGTLVFKATQPEVVTFSSLDQFSNFTATHKGQTVTLEYQLPNQTGRIIKEITLSGTGDAPLGVQVIENSKIRVVWYKAPVVALRETAKIIQLTGIFLENFFAKLFSSGHVSEQVGGPVAIYVFTGMAVKAGIMAFLQFIAILSINLALVNFLPFPALDGGRIVFILLEMIARKKVVKESVENIIHTVGFGLLIVLIVLITYKDIINLIKK